jgi:hypothetical protein
VGGEKPWLLLVFLRGLREFVVVKRGKSLVSLWWIAWWMWCFDTMFFAAENFPLF